MRKPDHSQKPALGLRNNAHRIEVIVPGGTTRPVLGTRHPDDHDARASAMEHFGGPRKPPRQQSQVAIELPLPQRTQTILTHRLSSETQERLNSGICKPENSRRRTDDATSEQLVSPDD